jgi:hypothetical protein
LFFVPFSTTSSGGMKPLSHIYSFVSKMGENIDAPFEACFCHLLLNADNDRPISVHPCVC